MAAWHWWQFNLTGERGELPEVVNAGAGSWNLFPLLGVQPIFGRSFTEAEDHPASDVVMLTWSVFQRRFAGNASIVGRQIHLDGKPYTVVGVLPASFAYPDAKVQVWVPYAAPTSPQWLKHHDNHQSRVIARLKPGVSLSTAISQVGAVQYRDHLENLHASVAEDVNPRSIKDDVAWNVKKPLIVLMGAVICMLLIGCLNVANPLVARGAAQQREIAVRTALGAQRLTLIREQMMESVLICFWGRDCRRAAFVISDAMAGLRVEGTPQHAGDPRGLGSAGVCVRAGDFGSAGGGAAARDVVHRHFNVCGSAGELAHIGWKPAAHGPAQGPADRRDCRHGGAAGGAGLLLKSFLRLQATNVGCDTRNVLTLSYSLGSLKYDKPDKVNAFNEALLERLRAMPGVRGAALGSVLPGAGYGGDDVFTIPEHPPVKPGADLPVALYRWADPGHFSALRIPLLRGRYFTSDLDDRADR
jgi:putative ABC transport system permease protein